MCAQQIYDDESMPKSQATTTGMKIIKGDYSNILARQEIEDIIYTKKNNKDLRIRMVYPTKQLPNGQSSFMYKDPRGFNKI